MWWLFLACRGGTDCADDQVHASGAGSACADYAPGDPVAAPEVWRPSPGTTWQWQLSGDIDTTVDAQMYDVDLFEATDAELAALRADGRVIVCYFSAGTVEDWRDDVGDVPDEAIGRKLPDWEGERWLDVSHPAALELATSRLELAVERGCDGVEPDNVDAVDNASGFSLTAADQLQFNRAVADEAHTLGLSVGLKNDLAQVEDLLDWFDWALNEECVDFDECDLLAPFTSAGKAAFHVEYVDDWDDAADRAAEVCGVGPDLDTLIKTWDLTAEQRACGR